MARPKKKASDNPLEGPSKTDVVKDALKSGIEKNAEIVEYAKAKGVEITPNYISIIKSNLRKKEAGESRVMKRGAPRGPRKAAPATHDAAALVRDVQKLVELYGQKQIESAMEFVAKLK